MTAVCPPCTRSTEGRIRLSRGSVELHTRQWHVSVGTPMDVPEPNTVNSRTEFAAGAGSADPQFVRRFNSYTEWHIAQSTKSLKKSKTPHFEAPCVARDPLFLFIHNKNGSSLQSE